MVVKEVELIKEREKEIKFYAKTHKYKKDKKVYKSVTQLIDTLFEPFEAKSVAKKLSKIPKYKKDKKGIRAILKEWKEKAEHGTRVHNAIEVCLKTTKIPLGLSKEDREKLLQARIFIANYWDSTKNKTSIFLPEQLIYSDTYNLAGTIDLIIYNYKTKDLYIIDWKTNDKITDKAYNNKKGIKESTKDIDDCKLNKYSIQLNIYAHILHKDYGIKPTKLSIIHLLPKGYKEIDIEINEKNITKILKEYMEE
jgi:hypothetical protein